MKANWDDPNWNFHRAAEILSECGVKVRFA